MKTLVLFLICLIQQSCLIAQNSSPNKPNSLVLLLKKEACYRYPDSVWVIFDRYNLTGPGILNRRYAVEKGQIRIDSLPKGKYYVDIICFGSHRKQYFSVVTTIRRKRKNRIRLAVYPIAFYTMGQAQIPAEKINFTKLAIFKGRASR